MIDTQQIADRLKAAEQAHRLPEQVASELLAAQSEGELVTINTATKRVRKKGNPQKSRGQKRAGIEKRP